MTKSLLFPMRQTKAVAEFRCTGDVCPDTCCKGWGMQLTEETVKKYEREAPELLTAVSTGESEWIMKRDATTDYCVKFDKGWCGIHAQYGDAMLGDACHFFPRITRAMGNELVMSASISCPEIARASLLQDDGFALLETQASRVPYSLKAYLPEGMAQSDAWALHQLFMDAALTEEYSAQTSLRRISSVARSLDFQPKESWGKAASFYMKTAETRLAAPEGNINDPFNLLNALQGLIGAARKSDRARLMKTIATMEQALNVSLDWDTLTIKTHEDSLQHYQAMELFWQDHCAAHYAPILRRWLAAQMSATLFPFAGLGDNLSERITIIGVRMATVKLALMSACYVTKEIIAEEDMIRVVQSIARFLDHLADPAFSLAIYTETGWTREARLAGLLG